ncbi:MAG: DUF2760 domain-containing protein [Desulfatibacillaceae bacterium]|nr:DUF2760 domain-containing protein [Desulfatibacillaceae bacterium]
MEWTRQFNRRSFWWTLLWMTLLCAALYGAVLWHADQLKGELFIALADLGQLRVDLMGAIADTLEWQAIYLTLTLCGLTLAFALMLWLAIRGVARRAASSISHKVVARKTGPKHETLEEKIVKIPPAERERQALSLLSLLQREGRLLDFFAEDLDAYSDDQIGAAVRGIHENCKKLLDKRIKPSPVMDQDEGSAVTLPAGFDPSTVKLTGNVSGEPPFKGIVRHRGWRAARFDMPILTTAGDPRLLAPAEVEIE